MSQKKLFELLATDPGSAARLGKVYTAHGEIETPVFMPVGTRGTVKGISREELLASGSQIILGNTYHLYLRPGTETLTAVGGLHKFAGWSHPLLTDSGGFQVFSLAGLRKIHKDGVRFQSHIDGSYHEFTPENVMAMQRAIGADIIMAFDECPPHPATKQYVADSNAITVAWAKRCRDDWREHEPLYGYTQALFGIVQGGVYPDLRKLSAKQLVELDLPGYAIGGLSVGEPKDAMLEMIAVTAPELPKDKPRYLMGVGKPEDLVEAVNCGIDMFDCVMPTRNGRKGQAFTWQGTVNLKNARFKDDFGILDEKCRSYTSVNYSKAYLRHLIQNQEMLGMRLVSLHNLHFYHDLMSEMRAAIRSGSFAAWRANFYKNYRVQKPQKTQKAGA